MNRVLTAIAFVSFLTLAFVASSQANSMANGGFTTFDATSLVGLTVKARDGVELGKIVELVVDSNGHVDFAIISQPGFYEFPGRYVVVPFSTLVISKGVSDKMSVVFNADKEKFYEGPGLGEKNLNNRKEAASLDRYYGIEPYWTRADGKTGNRS